MICFRFTASDFLLCEFRCCSPAFATNEEPNAGLRVTIWAQFRLQIKKHKERRKQKMTKTRKKNQRKRVKEWPRYCRKAYWTKMVRSGQNGQFGQNDFIPNGILALTRPKWTKMVHFGLKRSILAHLGPPTVLWPLLKGCSSKILDEHFLSFFLSKHWEKNFWV